MAVYEFAPKAKNSNHIWICFNNPYRFRHHTMRFFAFNRQCNCFWQRFAYRCHWYRFGCRFGNYWHIICFNRLADRYGVCDNDGRFACIVNNVND